MEIKSTKGLHSSQVKAIVYGESGNGKTSLLGTLPESKTLIISAESGLLCLDDKDIAVAEINTWPNLISVATMLVNDELPQFDYVCIDSLTELSDMLINTAHPLRSFSRTISMFSQKSHFYPKSYYYFKFSRFFPFHLYQS